MTPMKSPVKALCAVLAICIYSVFGMSVFAENCTAAAPETIESKYMARYKQNFEEAVVKLVKEGKLSKEKADKILEYKKRKEDESCRLTKEQKQHLKTKQKNRSLLWDLKQEGILTDSEVQIIRNKLLEMRDERIVDAMEGLIKKGVLKPEDIDNMREYMVRIREEQRAQIEKLKTMTPEERKVHYENIKAKRKDIITRMVEDKIITEEQAKEIKNAIPELNMQRLRKPKQKKGE